MLAQTEKFDVLYHHHFVELHREQRAVDHFLDAGVVAAGQVADGLLVALRRAGQALARGVFAQHSKHVFHARGDASASRRNDFDDRFLLHLVSSSNVFLAVSEMRTLARRAGSFQLLISISSIADARFSVVGTRRSSSGTSQFRFR